MLGNNLKVHWAGSEQLCLFDAALLAGVKYQLFTVFPFICKDFGIKPFPIIGVKDETLAVVLIKENIKKTKQTIMDSGLFTLMFGACKGRRDRKFIDAWVESLASFVLKNNMDVVCVEVDCQKILGVEEAWKVRSRLRNLLPKHRIINVFHLEDGVGGLDRLIEYSNYIAVSVPELRIHYGTGRAYQENTCKLVHYIKNKKPDIDIHLLGCTSKELLRRLNFCTSCDSTSWTVFNKFGTLRIGNSTVRASQLDEQKCKSLIDTVYNSIKARGMDAKRHSYYARAFISSKVCLAEYTKYAGSQE